MSLTHIEIAGLSIGLEGSLSALEMGLADRLGPFLTSPGSSPKDVLIYWREGKPCPPSPSNPIYDEGLTCCIYRVAGKRPYHVLVRYPSESGGYGAQALLEANPSWDDIALTETRQGQDWWSLLNVGVGEMIVRTRLVFLRGLVFHACGIDDNGRGLLFVGHSGAGKSTQAALWQSVPGVVVMNDERVAIRLENGQVACYGTPWGGSLDIAGNHKAPLAAIMVLEQSDENHIHLLSKEASFPMVLARCFLPYWEPELMERALEVLGELVNRVPVYLLRCKAEKAVIPLVRSVL